MPYPTHCLSGGARREKFRIAYGDTSFQTDAYALSDASRKIDPGLAQLDFADDAGRC